MLTGTAVYGTVRTVVWEDGGSNPASYPIPQYVQNIPGHVCLKKEQLLVLICRDPVSTVILLLACLLLKHVTG